MAKTIVIGDGPGGLSAALFLAKAGEEVVVYGENETAMHHALLRNYLGHLEIHGSELQEIGRRQVEQFGGALVSARVTRVAAASGGFAVTLDDGSSATADFLIMSEGRSPELALSLGLATDDDGTIVVDGDYRSSIERVYVIGRSARPTRSQAIISAGAGAAAALDILAVVAGKDVHDWDSPPRE
jgi:thioredoxin reductase